MSNIYHEEEINLVGMLPESDLHGDMPIDEMKRIIHDALGIGPMFNPLYDDLQRKERIIHGTTAR